MSDVFETHYGGEEPPEPEDEGLREEIIEGEKERKKRDAEKFDERTDEAIKYYKGVKEQGDQPGSALAERRDEEQTAS